MNLADVQGRFGDTGVDLTLSGSIQEVLIRVALDDLRPEVFLRNIE